MSFPELLQAFWFWWVTENNLYPYDPALFVTRGVQLGFVVGGLVFIFALIFSKKLRGRFF